MPKLQQSWVVSHHPPTQCNLGRQMKQCWMKYWTWTNIKNPFLLLDNQLKAFRFPPKLKSIKIPFRHDRQDETVHKKNPRALCCFNDFRGAVLMIIFNSRTWPNMYFISRGSLYQNTSTDERGGHCRAIPSLWDWEMLQAGWARRF